MKHHPSRKQWAKTALNAWQVAGKLVAKPKSQPIPTVSLPVPVKGKGPPVAAIVIAAVLGYFFCEVLIQYRFGPRMMEWFMSFHTVLLGVALLLPGDTLVQPTWSGFAKIFPSESWLGWIMAVLRLLRVGGQR